MNGCNHKKQKIDFNIISFLENSPEKEILWLNKILSFYLWKYPKDGERNLTSSFNFNRMKNKNLLEKIEKHYSENIVFEKNISKFCSHGKFFCPKCFGAVLHIGKNQTPSQKIYNFFKHIRNAFAHGYVFIYKNGNDTYFYLEDKLNEKSKVLTAQLIISKSFLLKLIDMLMN